MARPCSVCTNPNRAAIDAALISGEPHRLISSGFGVSEKALERHKGSHMTALLAKASAAEAIAADDLLERLHRMYAETLDVLDEAKATGNLNARLKAIQTVHSNSELLAKLTNQLNERPVVNILIAPEWLQVRAVLLDALGPYPDARVAVAGRLDALGAGHAGE